MGLGIRLQSEVNVCKILEVNISVSLKSVILLQVCRSSADLG